MHRPFLESFTSFETLALVAFVLIVFVVAFGKRIAWKLFSFDEEINTILSGQKSREVRLGKVAESLAPLLEQFPVDVEKPGTSTVFLGQPIDFIHFDPESGVTFIEVKSGNADLNSNQRKLRELIKAGKVRWEELKIR